MVVRATASTGFTEQAEERLLVEAAQKDPARFAELYELHFERVYAFIARRVCERDAAEDLTSEVFHKALANIGSFEWRGAPFAAWLFRIAANALADWLKRAGREVAVDDPPEFGAETDLAEVSIARDCFGWWSNFLRISDAWWCCVSRRRRVFAKLPESWGAARER